MTKALGPNFGNEVILAGLGGLPISWGPTSDDIISDQLTAEQQAALDAVVEAHDPAASYIPQVAGNAQLRLALLDAGMLDQAQAAVDGSSEEVNIEWEYAAGFDRFASPAVDVIAKTLALKTDQVDALFLRAQKSKG